MPIDLFNVASNLIVLGLLEGAIYSLFALGLSLIFGVMKIFNIAHGDMGILGGYLCYWVFVMYGIDPILALVLVLPLLCLIAFCVQRFMINPAIRDPRFQIIASVMITYGIALCISNQEIIIWTPDWRSLTLPYSYLSYSIFGLTLNITRVIVLLFTVAVTIFLLVLLRTKFGKALRACTQDREVSMLMGINFGKLAWVAFAIATAISGIAGMLYTLSHTFYPAVGLVLTIKSLTVMVFGGMGSISGAFVGGILLGVAEAVVAFSLGGEYRDLVSFLVLVMVLLFKPTGIFGKVFLVPK